MSTMSGLFPSGGQTTTSTSQYTIPGLQGAYNQLVGNAQGGYGALQNQVTQILQNMYNAAMKDTRNYGQSAALNTNKSYNVLEGQQQQADVSRGLGNATIMRSMLSGDEQRRFEDLNIYLPEEVSKMRNQVRSQFGQPIAAAMQGIGLAGLSAQQQLGMQYLNLLGQQGVHTQTQTSRSFVNPMAQQQGHGGGFTQSFQGRPNTFGEFAGGGGSGYSGAGFVPQYAPSKVSTSYSPGYGGGYGGGGGGSPSYVSAGEYYGGDTWGGVGGGAADIAGSGADFPST